MEVKNYKIFEASERYTLSNGEILTEIEAELLSKRTKDVKHFLMKVKKNHYNGKEIPLEDIEILSDLYAKLKS